MWVEERIRVTIDWVVHNGFMLYRSLYWLPLCSSVIVEPNILLISRM